MTCCCAIPCMDALLPIWPPYCGLSPITMAYKCEPLYIYQSLLRLCSNIMCFIIIVQALYSETIAD
jgi:hypothetical protein